MSLHPPLGPSYNPEAFFSGMALKPSLGREALNKKFYELGGVLLGFALGDDNYEDYDAIINSIDEIDGVDILEPGDFQNGEDYHCVHYAFGVVGNAKWARPYTPIDEDHGLSWRPIPFLRQRWYDLTPNAKPGDVVAYSIDPLTCVLKGFDRFEHYGVLQGGGRVISKFSQGGPIVEHAIGAVPDCYGSYASFFRKRQRTAAQPANIGA